MASSWQQIKESVNAQKEAYVDKYANMCKTYVNYCGFQPNTVITGSVITTIPRGGSLHATIAIINVYKEGSLAIQQAGKSMSAKIIVVCKQCPLIRRGLNYVIMGQVEEDGRGKILPSSFTMSFKTKNQKILNALKNKRC